MKKRKLFFACLLMSILSIGQVWAESKSFTISFKDNGSDATAALTTSNFTNQVASGDDSIKSVLATEKCYAGTGGLKISSNDYNGSFTIKLQHALTIDSVVLRIKNKNATTSSVTIGTSSSFTTSTALTDTAFINMTYKGTQTTSDSITVAIGGTTKKKRVGYLASMTIYHTVSGTGGSSDPATPTHELTYAVATASDGMGTLSATVGNATVNSGAQVAEGATVTMVPNAETGYQVKSIAAVTATVDATNYTFTMPNDDEYVEAVFEAIPVTSISLNKNATELIAGAEETLTVTEVLPATALTSVTWESNATAIATVDQNGKVTAVSAGEATITVRSAITNTITATCVVTVTAATGYAVTLNQVTGGTINADQTFNIAAGTTVTLSVELTKGYELTSWTVLDGDANEVTVTNNQFEMPASNVDVEAVFAHPEATMFFSVNGTEAQHDANTTHYMDDEVTLPLTATALSGKSFIGWTNAEIATATDNAPATIYAPGATYTLAKGKNTLYALYATAEGGDLSWSIGKTDISINDDSQSSTYAKYAGEQSKNNIGFRITDVMPNTMNNVEVLQFKKSTGTIYNDTIMGKDIQSIVITLVENTQSNVYVPVVYAADTMMATTPAEGNITATNSDKVYTYTVSGSGNRFFRIVGASNGTTYAASIVVNFVPNYSAYTTRGAVKPSIPTFDLTAGAYTEQQIIIAETETTGATIYYTLDGTDPTDSENAARKLYDVNDGIELTERGTYNVWAAAYKDNVYSDIRKATYTLNLPYIFNTVSDFNTYITDNNLDALENVTVTGVVSKITSLDPSKWERAQYYISDNGTTDNQFYIYNGYYLNGAAFTSTTEMEVGDKVTIQGNYTTYNSKQEFGADNQITSITKKVLSSVVVSGTPDQTEYFENDEFSTEGLVVTANYQNTGYSVVVTEGITWETDLTDNKVTTSGNVMVQATYNNVQSEIYEVAVTISSKTLTSIELSQTEYTIYKTGTYTKPSVIAHFDDNTTEDVTTLATDDAATAFNDSIAGFNTITVSYEFGGVIQSAQYTVTVQEYANADDAPYTVTEALPIIEIFSAASTDSIVVAGTVSEANIAGNKNRYRITDGTNTLLIYGGKGFNSANFTNTNYPQVGDTVIVKGNVVNYLSGNTYVPQFASGKSRLLSQIRPVAIAIEDVTSFEVGTADLSDEDLTITTASTGAITFSSGDESKVTIVEGKLHAIAAGTATITAHIAATNDANVLNYAAGSTTFDVTVIDALPRYTVSFVANGGAGTAPVVANQLENASFNLPENTFYYSGYTFTGWNDGTNTYAAGDAYTMPAANVVFTAQWEEDSREAVVFVFAYNDKFYAMGQTISSKALNTIEIDVFNGRMLNVSDETKAAITWYKGEVEGGYTFQAANGKYLEAISTDTKLSLSENSCTWTYNEEDGYYAQGTRTLLASNGTTVKNYAASNINTGNYSAYAMLLTEYVNGTVDTLRQGLEAGKIGTLCWNKELVEVEGAVLFDPEYPAIGQAGVGFIETTSYAAGKPFVFQATGKRIRAIVTGEATTVAGTNNGLVGVFTLTNVPDGDYIVYQNRIHRAYNSTVSANRAYLHMEDVTDQRAANGDAPSRRRLVIGDPTQTPTDNEQIGADTKAEKVVIDGQIYIRRGEKMFDLTGKMVH